MASISASIGIQDFMTPQISTLNNALNTTVMQIESINSNTINMMGFNALNQSVGEVNSNLTNMTKILTDIKSGINANRDGQKKFNNDLKNGKGYANDLASSIQRMVTTFLGIATIRKSISWIGESLDLTNIQTNAERQLQVVLANVGATEKAFKSLKETASSIQGYSLYGDESMIGGAAELATYISDTNAIESMMGTLANYAAGMSGGGEVSYQEMVNYATQLGKALDGTYDGLTKKGFVLSEAQKEIIENGNDMQKALVLDEVISQSWGGLAETMANTPQGKIIQMKNAWGDIREEIGNKLYPAVYSFFDTINNNMPIIENLMNGFAISVQVITLAVNGLINGVSTVFNFVSDNWSVISPILYGIGAALLFVGAYLLLTKTYTALATAAQWAYNTALCSCPLVWIVLAIIAVVAAICLVIEAFNKWTGSTVSAVGVIIGVLAVASAFLWNTFVGVVNAIIQFMWVRFVEPFISIIEWVLNVCNGGFNSFGDAVANLIGNIIGWFLSLGQVVTKIIDAIFGTDWTSGLNNLKNEVIKWGKNENAITLDREAPTILDRVEYGSAWDTGYHFGEDLSNMDLSGYFTEFDNLGNWGGSTFYTDDLLDGVLTTADNTSSIASSLEVSEEQLKYLRDIASRDTINRFTTAEIKVENSVNANINNDMDLDGVVDYISAGVIEAIEITAEGVHT